jgi:hypothetical protein
MRLSANDEPFTILPGPTIESYRYVGPEGEVDFDVGTVYWKRQPVIRDGHEIEVIAADSLRRPGDRSGASLNDDDRAHVLDNLRLHYRKRGRPFEIRHPSGAREDETGQVRPGFRTGLPTAEHSDGWSLTDLYMSPAFPDPNDYPPTVTYHGPEGEAELAREFELVDSTRPIMGGSIQVREKVRRRVLHPDSLHWTGDRAGQHMTDEDRARILDRAALVYDTWGHAYVVRPESGTGIDPS